MVDSAGLPRLTEQIQEQKDMSKGVGNLSRRTISLLASALLSLYQEDSGSKAPWRLQVALTLGHFFRFLQPWVQWRRAA